MAYMSQEHKKRIAEKLKSIMPEGWKYSLSVSNSTSIVLTISKAPVDLIGILHENSLKRTQGITKERLVHYYDLNPYKASDCFSNHPDLENLFTQIVDALNLDNYNNSDTQRDHIDVGHYVGLKIGKFNKPFEVSVLKAKP